jgi:hypothetical protein
VRFRPLKLTPESRSRARARGTALAAPAALLLALLTAAPALSRPSGEDFWTVNGQVLVTKLAGTTLYIAGEFSRISPRNGGAVPFDVQTGLPVSGFPRVKGTVYALIPDGSGGWYIGGSFRTVGGKQCTNIAHVLPDMTVADWNVGFEHTVLSLAVDGDVLYVNHGGALDAIDVVTRETLPFHAEFDGEVRVIAPADGRLIVAGDFMQVNGAIQYGIAALDPVTGALLDWKPAQGLGAPIGARAVAIISDVIYVGGRFGGKLNGTVRRNAAAFDLETGATLAWNPDPDGDVSSLLLRDGVVYAGGGFQNIGGQPRAFLAALDPASGVATSWNAAPDARVDQLVPGGDRMWISGEFSSIGGVSRTHIAQLDRLSGVPTAWSTPAVQGATHISLGFGAIYVAGATLVGSVVRNGTAAFDIETGMPTAWDPGASAVSAIEVDRGVVYLGGRFTSIGGHPRRGLAAVSAASGQLLPWDPALNNAVLALHLEQRTLIVAGDFTSIGGTPRHRLAAFGTASHRLLPWNPDVNQEVRSIVSDGHVLYLGGMFTAVGSQPRGRLAAVRLSDGRVTPWDPGADNEVFSLARSSGSVFAGGRFEHVGGQARAYLAGIDERTGLVTSFDPHPDDFVVGLAADGAVLYTGIVFSRTAAFNAATGARLSWAPRLLDSRAFATAGGLAYVGCRGAEPEEFSEISGLDVGPAAVVPGAAPNFIAGATRSLTIDRLDPRAFRLRFTLDAATPTRLEIYDVSGRRVAKLADADLQPGEHEFTWDTRGAATRAGVYFAALDVAGVRTSRKLVVL